MRQNLPRAIKLIKINLHVVKNSLYVGFQKEFLDGIYDHGNRIIFAYYALISYAKHH